VEPILVAMDSDDKSHWHTATQTATIMGQIWSRIHSCWKLFPVKTSIDTPWP